MRVYFEDGPLWSGFTCDERINGNDGISKCIKSLDMLHMNEIDTGTKYAVYTNFPLALCCGYAWDDKNQRPDIFIRDSSGVWRNVAELTNRTLRYGHNILNLYIGGEFGEWYC